MTAYHGFVDESIRRGVYRLTMVRVANTALTEAARTVRQAIPKGQVRVHLSAESPSRRRQFLRSLADIPMTAIVFETPYDGVGDDQVARDRCLSSLVAVLADKRISVLVLDTRGHERDRRDRTRLGIDLAATEQDDTVTFSHRGSRDELLIALPDAIGWAIGAAAPWPGLVRSLCEVRRIPETA